MVRRADRVGVCHPDRILRAVGEVLDHRVVAVAAHDHLDPVPVQVGLELLVARFPGHQVAVELDRVQAAANNLELGRVRIPEYVERTVH